MTLPQIYMPPEPDFDLIPSIPHSREAEEGTVGAVLINPEIHSDVAAFLKDTDFYIERHKWLWQVFGELTASGTPIDLLTITEALDRKGRLTEIGGPAFLTSLINQVPSSLNAESYGRIVEGHSIRRKMIAAANQIASYAYDEKQNVEVIAANSRRVIEEATNMDTDSDSSSISELASRHYDMVEYNSQNPLAISGIQTGLIDLDPLLDGLLDSVSYCVAGRPKQGKTSLVTQIALAACGALGTLPQFRNVANQNKHVAFFSRESPAKEIFNRMASVLSGVDSQLLKKGRLTEAQGPYYTHAIDTLSLSHLKIFEPRECPTIERIQAHCKSLAARGELDLVIADYLQLFGTSGAKRYNNREQEVSAISRGFAELATNFGVPVVLACQMNRSVEGRSDKYPVLSDLRESGAIEQDAGAVLFIHHNDVTKIILAAHRHGPIGEVEVHYNKPLTRFENLSFRRDEPVIRTRKDLE